MLQQLRKFTTFYLWFVFLTYNFAQSTYEKEWQSRIILNITEDPSSSIAVTWQTQTLHQHSYAQVAEATNWIEFKDSTKSFDAKVEEVKLNTGQSSFHYSVVFKGLKPNTLYVYRVCNDSVENEWNQFKTAQQNEAPFQFVYLGDPQNNIKAECTRVFSAASKKSPNAAFWLIAGDLIGEPSIDSLWNDLFYSLGFIPKETPFVPVTGNHEYRGLKYYTDLPKEERDKKILTPLWKVHFTLPENGVENLEETTYYFDYQGVRFIILNGTNKLDEQLPWLDKLLAENPNRWTIVSIHQAVYSTGKDRNTDVYRNKLRPYFDKYSVDLVLQGHEHTYGRTYKLNDEKIVDDNDKGTVYVTSVSGPKQYKLNDNYKNVMVKMGGKTQLYQVISINKSKLDFKSYTVTGELYDSFELNK